MSCLLDSNSDYFGVNRLFESGYTDICANVLCYLSPTDKASLSCLSKATAGKLLDDAKQLSWHLSRQIEEKEIVKFIKDPNWKMTSYSGGLDLSHSKRDSAQLDNCVSRFPNLTQLDLSSARKLRSSGLKLLQHVPHLKMLDMSNCKISIKGLENLRSLTQLQQLNLSYTFRVNNWELAQILQCSSGLKRLALKGSKKIGISSPKANLPVYSQNMPLKYLDLSNTGLSDCNFLKECQSLRYLDLNSSGITDISPIASYLTKLMQLKLGYCWVDNTELLTALTNLQVFVAPNTFSIGLNAIAPKFTKIKKICFPVSCITPQDTVLLAQMSDLRNIVFPNALYLQNEDLKPLQSLKELKKMTGNFRDPDAVFTALPQLKEITAIRIVNLGNGHFQEERAKLKNIQKWKEGL